MKKFLCVILAVVSSVLLHAQYKVQFILKEKTAIQHDSIYVTGSFSNWDSTLNKNYLLKREAGIKRTIILNLPAGEIKYKFHRGSWLTVEKDYFNDEVPDRIINIHKDTILIDSVLCWRDERMIDKKISLQQQTTDTGRIKVLAAISNDYAYKTDYYNSDSALAYAQQALLLNQKAMTSGIYKTWDPSYLPWLQEMLATLFHSLGNFPKSLQLRLENLKLLENGKFKYGLAYALKNVSSEYYIMKDYQNALYYSRRSDSVFSTIAEKELDYYNYIWNKFSLAKTYYHLNKNDSAIYYLEQIPDSSKLSSLNYFPVYTYALRGDIYAGKENKDTAFYYYRYALAFALRLNDNLSAPAIGLAKLFQKENKIDSALYYARMALKYYESHMVDIQTWGENSALYMADVFPLLADLYKSNHQMDSAYKYLHLSVALKDSIYTADKLQQFQSLTFNESSRKQQQEQQAIESQRQYETKIKMIGLITAMAAILIVAFILYRNNKHKQKANTLLQSQKEEIETTLEELKNTQKQLIQSEKMASLGELTAGIAHEIQNPLNFVNNFSEVNAELIEEMVDEVKKGNTEEAISIANDIKENEEKINHHGKRADAIVKGMLQHSRSSSGQKEPTDINALCDEYLSLSYHGLRAKDKNFNATLKTDFDESIEKINIIPQDIGRVILNLFTNAFYAVNQKKQQGVDGYEPTVSISTKKIGNKIQIQISDNGDGIPQKFLDKIFQPFFTTKPTGQGTGLGLSLSYDIVTKGHGGELKVETRENEGTKFIIMLPL